MHLLIEMDYGNSWKEIAPDKESWDEIREGFPTFPPEYPCEKESSYFHVSGAHLLNDENVKVASKYGIRFKIAESVAKGGVGQMIVKLQDRIKALELDKDNKAELMRRGGAVQIHVPDLVLLGYDEVTYLDDCCTDELQTHLDDGWRILAVCPPNAARRPDYILGRKRRLT